MHYYDAQSDYLGERGVRGRYRETTPEQAAIRLAEEATGLEHCVAEDVSYPHYMNDNSVPVWVNGGASTAGYRVVRVAPVT